MMKQKSIAEFIGTFMIIFMGCGSIMINECFPGTIPLSLVPFIFGLSVAVMVYAVGHISGAHFNPAVTLAFTLTKHFPKKEIAFYFIAQFAGALLAIGLLKVLLPDGISSYGETLTKLPLISSIIWEIILSFFLMFVIIAVATDSRAEGTMAGLAIGSTVSLNAFVGGPLTGASMNPARSLAPALFSGNLDSLWIYFIGPFVGTILAGLVYEWIRCHNIVKSSKGCC